MAKFTYEEALRVTRTVDTMSAGDFERFVNRMLVHIRDKDDAFYLITKGITPDDFSDQVEFYAWFYRWFVGE